MNLEFARDKEVKSCSERHFSSCHERETKKKFRVPKLTTIVTR